MGTNVKVFLIAGGSGYVSARYVFDVSRDKAILASVIFGVASVLLFNIATPGGLVVKGP